ncbi:hypothetical protein [Chthonobacter albigriseus]|uniref:hypothetical protein n=1 Tax=Chthonobacter albigriseus TaxID=1683161 RepID=UPI0015EFD3D8|nr:hypothetical protein [Chthonobacter albigriseus]
MVHSSRRSDAAGVASLRTAAIATVLFAMSTGLVAGEPVAPPVDPLPAPAETNSAEPPLTPATCPDLRDLVAAWRDRPPSRPGIRLEGTVAKVEHQGPLAFTYICEQPDAVLVCFEYERRELRPGDRVVVEGIVAGTWDKGPVLDPCGTTRLE